MLQEHSRTTVYAVPYLRDHPLAKPLHDRSFPVTSAVKISTFLCFLMGNVLVQRLCNHTRTNFTTELQLATMTLRLISATPSPYARINRIAMIEKGIDFELSGEIPWHNDTETPKYNPLEKLPVLIFDDGREPIYDSAHIQDYIIQKYASQGPKLITGDLDTDLRLKQVQVLSEGVMDAAVLAFFEKAREKGKQSQSWRER